jgi:bifunctional non-homologous end joining protein LigD
MLASLADAPLDDPQFVYEPKYDGIRAIVEVGGRVSSQNKAKDKETRPPIVHLWSRLGNEKTHQFPEIAAALQKWARGRNEPLVLDGEIVALDDKGEPTGFQQLQGRIHLGGRGSEDHARRGDGGRGSAGAASARSNPDPIEPVDRVALIAFDVLREGKTDYRDRPLRERRAALERIFGRTGSPLLRISRQVRGDGRALYKEAVEHGWEGLIAKQVDSLYKSGKRTPDWRKIKIVHEQEFVIGGWTEPRQTRSYFGALLLGVYEHAAESGTTGKSRIPNPASLVYAGHTGTGFTDKELARVMKLLKPLETKESPFKSRPKTNERPHWVRPELVAQIKFTEWTADAKLRHPVYLGLRDDKRPAEVRREEHPPERGSKVQDSRVQGS